MVKPNKEADLDEKVKGDPGNEEGGTGFNNGGGAKDDPIREPLLVVGGAGRVDGLEGHICGVEEGDQVAHELATANEEDEAADEEAKGEEEEGLGLAGLFFQFP